MTHCLTIIQIINYICNDIFTHFQTCVSPNITATNGKDDMKEAIARGNFNRDKDLRSVLFGNER